jgi:hypothetical protein
MVGARTVELDTTLAHTAGLDLDPEDLPAREHSTEVEGQTISEGHQNVHPGTREFLKDGCLGCVALDHRAHVRQGNPAGGRTYVRYGAVASLIYPSLRPRP